ncbi:hypothetical protein IFM89_019414 [Coptis chinensis]|uniref:AMP-activated protein kinase glycogen-binding domain-containing protein n=1 Tax=Coptis chinensis TaxID=261450 RepID=A0A835ITI7_9MAGN|nr:hypothetical protein IFM89_019414 [Coptis chinensis]
MNDPHNSLDAPQEQGIPTLITWTFGGNIVAVQGSWDNWTSREDTAEVERTTPFSRVLPSGIYRDSFLVDGEHRYIPDLPCIADDTGLVDNLLDVHGKSLRVKISLGDSSINYFSIKLLVTGLSIMCPKFEGIAEFEPPPSPDSSYGHTFPWDEDFLEKSGAGCSTPITPHVTFGTRNRS